MVKLLEHLLMTGGDLLEVLEHLVMAFSAEYCPGFHARRGASCDLAGNTRLSGCAGDWYGHGLLPAS